MSTSGIYTPLDEAQRQIRVLSVRIDDSGELPIVECRLHVISLASEPTVQFQALSYVWGIEPPSRRVKLDGEWFMVRPNLFAFLYRRAAFEENSVGIFVDAMCIDQDNLPERNSQVALMGDVYRQAEKVIVWFGLEEHWVPELVENCTEVLLPGWLQGYMEFALSQGDLGKGPEGPVFFHLMEHAYWSRLWTVQEYILPSRIELQFGPIHLTGAFFDMAISVLVPSMFKFEAFVSAALAIEGVRDKEGGRAFNCIMFVRERLGQQKTSEGSASSERRRLPLYHALTMFSEQQCTEWRDKIFGLLGLCSATVAVDQTISPTRLYIIVLKQCLLQITEDATPSTVAQTLVGLVKALSSALNQSLKHKTVEFLTICLMGEPTRAANSLTVAVRIVHSASTELSFARWERQEENQDSSYMRVRNVYDRWSQKCMESRFRRTQEMNPSLTATDGEVRTAEQWFELINNTGQPST